MKHLLTTTAMALVLGLWMAPAANAQSGSQGQQGTAQKQQPSQQSPTGQQSSATSTQTGDQPPVVLLRDWNYDTIYSKGWSVKNLMDEAEVYGPGGDDSIGNVKNVLVSDKGRILGIIAEVGGFLDIGDTHVFIPWNQVKFSEQLDKITIPVTEENVENYAYKDPYLGKAEAGTRQVVESGVATGPRIWKASELLGDYAHLNGYIGYGWISDLIFTNEGDLHAVVVNADPTYGGGNYAFPYYGYGYAWHPGAPYYNLRYNKEDVTNLAKFDHDKMKDRMAMQNDAPQNTGSASGAAKSGSSNMSGSGSNPSTNQQSK